MNAIAPNGIQRRERFMRLDAVEQETGLKKSTIYAAMRAGTFPQPVRLSLRCVAWRDSEIQRWMSQRIAESQVK